MKKTILLLSLFVMVNYAQTNKVTGNWLMTKAESIKGTKNAYFIMNFKPNNVMEAMGMKVGTWEFNNSKNTIIMKSKFDQDFNGEGKIVKLTDKQLVIQKGDWKFYYKKIDVNKIKENNKNSGLAGMWKIQDDKKDISKIIKFELPDNFTYVEVTDYSTERSSGTWIYEPEANSLIIISQQRLLRGETKIKELSNSKLVLTKDTLIITAKRIEPDKNKIERLTFKEEDFPEDEDTDINSQLPWIDFEQMADYLSGIQKVTYRFGTLITETNELHYTTIISKVKVDPNKPSVDFKNLKVSENDTTQYSENYKGGLSELYNNFFPEKELFPVRINGTKSVTVPAGVFDCTVVEGFDGDTKVRLYMINDKPGIFAKIIKENIDPFDKLEYTVKELVKIN